MTAKLRQLNSQSAFESFLKSEYAKDSSGKTEHTRRQDEIRDIINQVDQALRIHFGFSSGALLPFYFSLLTLLKSDPAFELKEVSSADLDKIKSRLLELVEEDIHFGQSAVYALYELLLRADSVERIADRMGCTSSLDLARKIQV